MAGEPESLDTDESLEVRPVQVGQISDDRVEILGGLSPGDKIVTSGALFIDRAASSD